MMNVSSPLDRIQRGGGRISVASDGDGNVSRSLEIAGPRPYIDVRAYGATGDGVTNDTAAIVAAFAAVPAGGCVVFFPIGNYIVLSNITAPNDTILLGSGYGTLISTGTARIIMGNRTEVHNMRFIGTGGSYILFSQGNARNRYINCSFENGGNQIYLNACSDFEIIGTRHTGSSVALTARINIFACNRGSIIDAQIEPYTEPTAGAGQGQGIQIQNSNFIDVVGGVIRGIDFTQVSTGAGVSFSGATFCTITGTIITNLKNGDGVVTQGGSTDILICNVSSTFNHIAAGAGANGNTGDGIDIFDSFRIQVSNCNLRGNGTLTATPHHNCEIFESIDVTVVGCDTSDGGLSGIAVAASPRTKVIGCTSSRNDQNGLLAQDIAGVPSTDLFVLGGEFNDNGEDAGGALLQEGLALTGGSTGTIFGVIAKDTRAPGSKTQLNGINIQNTSSFILQSNRLTGNNTAAIVDPVGTSTKRDNVGYNPIGVSTVAVGASPFTFTAGGSPLALYIRGGTISNISKNGRTIFVVTDATIYLEAFEACIITWSVLPTIEKDEK